MSQLKGFDGTIRQVGGSKMIVIPDWLIKSEQLEEAKQYKFFIEVV
jgi:antitoxin component of MazEF toxin-antitoxin module